jgi:hypothetical protein
MLVLAHREIDSSRSYLKGYMELKKLKKSRLRTVFD